MAKIKKLEKCPCGRVKVNLDGKECWLTSTELMKQEAGNKNPPKPEDDEDGNPEPKPEPPAKGKSFWDD